LGLSAPSKEVTIGKVFIGSGIEGIDTETKLRSQGKDLAVVACGVILEEAQG
jgi:hypothetical protein